MTLIYPDTFAERNRWIESRRGRRNPIDPFRPYGIFTEDEIGHHGGMERCGVVLLSNRECPWRCLMCDLWKNTLLEPLPVGAAAGQVRLAMDTLGPVDTVKLYNSGSFFDTGAIAPEEYVAIASNLDPVHRVIVESHPALIGRHTFRFRDLLRGRLEVAMGLETVDANVLARLNKGMTLEQFSAAAKLLGQNEIDLRVFVLIRPPFTNERDAAVQAMRSIDFAFDCGATAVSLIPVRAGNGALDALAEAAEFEPPTFETVEAVAEYGLRQRRGRVFVDLWETNHVRGCVSCRPARRERLQAMNRTQTVPKPVACPECRYERASI